MFTSTSRTIYKVNSIYQYIERVLSTTNNEAIISILLQHKEENFLKLTVKNRPKQIRSKKMVD